MARKPKFKVGDRVRIHGESPGVVSYVGEYDSYIGQYRYKVQEPGGTRLTWNENSLSAMRRRRR